MFTQTRRLLNQQSWNIIVESTIFVVVFTCVEDHLDDQITAFSEICFGHVAQNIAIIVNHQPKRENFMNYINKNSVRHLTERMKTHGGFQGQIYRCREVRGEIRTGCGNCLCFPSGQSRG